jgi:hypothetical protein
MDQAPIESMSQLKQVCLCCISDGVPMRSFIVALVVGTILNLINQGDALFSGGRLDLTKALLTYLVPYCVATYGAVSYRMRTTRRSGG